MAGKVVIVTLPWAAVSPACASSIIRLALAVDRCRTVARTELGAPRSMNRKNVISHAVSCAFGQPSAARLA